MTDLAKLRKLAEAATPGPWYSDGDDVFYIFQRCCGRGYQECCGEPEIDRTKVAVSDSTDAAFIAAANPATVLELIAALTSAKAEIEKLKELVVKKDKALRPFANEASRYEPPESDNDLKAWSSQFTIGDLRRARAALEATDGK